MQPRPVLFLIDVEPNTPYDRACDAWTGTQTAFAELERLRHVWEDATGQGAVFNWFLRCDPQIRQVWGRRDHIHALFPDFLSRLRDGQDYAGIHPHFWRWDMRGQRWYNDFTDAHWKEHCIRTSITGFQEMLGRRPQASRCGDRWMDQGVMDLLVREGIRYDLTLEPGSPAHRHWCDRHATERLPDQRHIPRRPYQPRTGDYRKARASDAQGPNLWMIPCSQTAPGWGLMRRFPLVGRFERTYNLALWPRVLQRNLEEALYCSSADPLVLVLRSGDLARAEFLQNFRSTTAAMRAHRGLRDVRLVAVPEALARGAEPVDGAGAGTGEDLALGSDAYHVMGV